MESGKAVMFGMVVLLSMLALSYGEIECYVCTGTTDAEPCGNGAKFLSTGTAVTKINCTNSCSKSVANKVVARTCGAGTAGKICAGGACVHTCTTALCNHADLPRYALPALVLSLVLAVVARFSHN